MGASKSKLEEDKSLQLCRDRKKYLKRALDGRCLLADTHVTYIQSLKNTGRALQDFFEPEVPTESSSPTDVTPDSVLPNERRATGSSSSSFSNQSPSLSPLSRIFQVKHLKSARSSSKKIKEKLHIPVTETARASGASSYHTTKQPAHKFESIPQPSPTLPNTPWDYFNLFHPIDDHLSVENEGLKKQGSDNNSSKAENVKQAGEKNDRIFESEIEEEGNITLKPEDSDGSEDVFFEPLSEDRVRSFRYMNMVPNLIPDHSRATSTASASSAFSEAEVLRDGILRSPQLSPLGTIAPASSVPVNLNLKKLVDTQEPDIEEKVLPKEISRSPQLSPLGTIAPASSVPVNLNLKKLVDTQEPGIEEKVLRKEISRSPQLSPLATMAPATSVPANQNLPKFVVTEVHPSMEAHNVGSVGNMDDLFSSMRDIAQLFVNASESGQEVPMMLEANKLNFRPILPKRNGESYTSKCVIACFSCGEDPSQVPEEPVQGHTKYLTWQKTMPARSLSSMTAVGNDAREGLHANSLDNIYCMQSGSHASTLDRLYAWEKKLYDEVKVSKIVRNAYDMKCKFLAQQESSGQPAHKVDKTRAGIKDLHSRIQVEIKRMESISKKIEEIRDNELQPQLEELVKGLCHMWEMMHECHKLQVHLISAAIGDGTKITVNSESRQQITNRLQQELSLLASSFGKWIAAHNSYLQAIDRWLLRCVLLPEKSSRRKRKQQPVSIREYGPPIFVMCSHWLKGLDSLPTKDLKDSIKNLAAETSRLLPCQDKHHRHHGDNSSLMSSYYLVGKNSSLVQFFEQLNNFSESSAKMYNELDTAIQGAKTKYDQLLRSQQEQQPEPEPSSRKSHSASIPST